MINEDVLADLPPARDDEPSSLRRDIADELGDHLACAFHRELVKSGDEAEAKDRVLERFGDPRRIARQLWWQAMWSRIMLQKISIALQSVLTVVLVVLVGLQFNAQQHQALLTVETSTLRQQTAANQQLLTQLVEQLRDVDLPRRVRPPMGGDASMMMPGGGSADSMMYGPVMGSGMDSGMAGTMTDLPAGASSLSLVLTMETEDGPPAEGCLVAIFDDADKTLPLSVGTPNAEMSEQMSGSPGGAFGDTGELRTGTMFRHDSTKRPRGFRLSPEAQGRIHAGRVDPGRYTVVIELANDWVTHHRIVVRPGEQRVEKIASPTPTEKAFVTITAPSLPEDLRSRGITTREPGTQLRAVLFRRPDMLGRVKWDLLRLRKWELSFDPQTGLLSHTQDSPIGPYHNQPPGRSRDLFDEAPDERFLVLPTGTYELAMAIDRTVRVDSLSSRTDQLAALGDMKSYPPSKPGVEFTLQPGQNTWTLDRAAELFEPARKTLKELPAIPSPADDAPAEATTSAEQVTTLQVRLATEKISGPSPAFATVRVKGQDLLNQSVEGTKTKFAKDVAGPLDFGELLPGQYSFEVTTPGGRTEFIEKVARGEANVVEIVSPPAPERAELKFELSVPKDLTEKQVSAIAEFEAIPFEFAERTWQPRTGALVFSSPDALRFVALRTGSRYLERQRLERAPAQVRTPPLFSSLQAMVRAVDQSSAPPDDGTRPVGLKYRLVGLVLMNEAQNRSRFADPVVVLRTPKDDTWPKALDEPFEFTAGKVWKVAIPEEMLQAAREQLEKLAKPE